MNNLIYKSGICWAYNSLNDLYFVAIFKHNHECLYRAILNKKEFEIFKKIMVDNGTAILYLKHETLALAAMIKINCDKHCIKYHR